MSANGTNRRQSTATTGADNAQSSARRIGVHVRKRPASQKEREAGLRDVVHCRDSTHVTLKGKDRAPDKTYDFDSVHGPHATQEDVFNGVARPLVDAALDGFSATMFAYGQTGTGKTYTMEGALDEADEKNMGIIPRSVHYITKHLAKSKADYTLKLSVLQIYNEQLHDLLDPETKKELKLFKTQAGEEVCQNLEEATVTDAASVMQLLVRASEHRRTAETAMNRESSRSHLLCTIYISVKESMPDGEDMIKKGRLNLIDLAGSECIGRSQARGKQAKEAGNINKSLQSLKRVITALVDRHSHVPYRDSKLTRLLTDSLGGAAIASLIATVSPDAASREETQSTLAYMHTAKNIKNKPQQNSRTTKRALIRGLNSDIDRYKEQLQAARDKSGVYLPQKHYDEMQEQIESNEARAQELEAALEVKQQQLEEAKTEQARAEKEIESLGSKLDATQTALSDEQQAHNASKNVLERTQVTLQDTEAVLKETAATESALRVQAEGVRDALHKSEADNVELYAKIGRKTTVESNNTKALEKLRGTAGESCEQTAQAVASFGEAVQDDLKQLCHLFSTHDEEYQLACNELTAKHSQMLTQCRDAARASHDKAQAVQGIAAEKLEGIEKTTFEHLDAQKSRSAQAVSDAESHYGQLMSFLEQQDEAHRGLQQEVQSKTQALLERTLAFVKEHTSALELLSKQVAEERSAVVKQAREQQQLMEAAQREQQQLVEQKGREVLAALTEQLQGYGAALQKHTAATAQSVNEAAKDVENRAENLASSTAAAVESLTSETTLHEAAVNEAGKHMQSSIDTAQSSWAEQNATVKSQLESSLEKQRAAAQESDADAAASAETVSTAIKDVQATVQEHSEHQGQALFDVETECQHAEQEVKAMMDTMSEKVGKSHSELKQTAEQQAKRATEFGDAQQKLASELRGAVDAHQLLFDEPTGRTPSQREAHAMSGFKRTREADVIIASSRKKRSTVCRSLAMDTEAASADVPSEEHSPMETGAESTVAPANEADDITDEATGKATDKPEITSQDAISEAKPAAVEAPAAVARPTLSRQNSGLRQPRRSTRSKTPRSKAKPLAVNSANNV